MSREERGDEAMGVPINIASLTIEERLELIEQLWDSIEDERIELSPAQLAELERRLANFDPSKAMPAEEFEESLRSRIG